MLFCCSCLKWSLHSCGYSTRNAGFVCNLCGQTDAIRNPGPSYFSPVFHLKLPLSSHIHCLHLRLAQPCIYHSHHPVSPASCPLCTPRSSPIYNSWGLRHPSSYTCAPQRVLSVGSRTLPENLGNISGYRGVSRQPGEDEKTVVNSAHPVLRRCVRGLGFHARSRERQG